MHIIIYLSVCPSVRPSVRPSVCLSLSLILSPFNPPLANPGCVANRRFTAASAKTSRVQFVCCLQFVCCYEFKFKFVDLAGSPPFPPNPRIRTSARSRARQNPQRPRKPRGAKSHREPELQHPTENRTKPSRRQIMRQAHDAGRRRRPPSPPRRTPPAKGGP